jgi:hypothetical protein
VLGLLEHKLVLLRGFLIDLFLTNNKWTEGKKLWWLALGKIVQYLRNAGGLFNKVYINKLSEISNWMNSANSISTF